MKTTRSARRYLVVLLVLVAGSIAAPQPARADLIDDFAWVLDQVPGVFPVSGTDIKDSRAFFQDLANAKSDTDVANLLQKYKDTPIGQQATAAVGGVPSWFWDLIDTYVAFRTNDFWGVVGHLGEAAICIVAQVMTGGSVDVCGLIEELVKLGQALLDAATAVAEFLASVGEGAVDVVQDIGCSLGLGGCDESSPPEQRAYAWVFAPEVPEGLTARKALDPLAFGTLRKQLEADASAKPAKLHITVPDWLKEYYSAGVVSTASGAYAKTVDAQWTADMAKNVLPQLAKKRAEYDSPQQVAAVALEAAAGYKLNPKNPPYTSVPNLCTDDFAKGFGYAHVDRWIATFPGDAKALGDVKTNAQWCQATFWAKNKDKFAEHFRNYTKVNFCPQFGSTLLCPTISKYESCLGLMGSVGQKDQCGVNIAFAGKEAAEKVYANLKTKGLKIPCTIVADTAPIGGKPAALVCTRPTQKHACDETYKALYGTLPVKLVDCVVEKNAAYKALESKVVQAVSTLNGTYGSQGVFGVDAIDPLIVHAPSPSAVADVQQQNPNFGFGPPSSKPGFDYFGFQIPRSIDGMSTPALGKEVKLPKYTQAPQLNKIQEKIALVKPGDPDPTLKSSLDVQAKPSAVMGAAQLQAPAPTKTMSGSAPPGTGPGASKTGSAAVAKGTSVQAKAVPGAATGPQNPLGAGTPAPAPTSGPAPGGSLASQGGGRASAEIRSGPRVLVAGKYPVVWGQGVAITQAEARRAQNGICDVALGHETINAGTAASGPFSRRWANQQNPAPFTDTYPSIPAGGSLQRTDTLPLKPGANRLTLTLDPLNQVKETNDADNIYYVTVTVSGSCGLPSRGAPPGTGGGVQTAPGSQSPSAPAQRRLNLPGR